MIEAFFESVKELVFIDEAGGDEEFTEALALLSGLVFGLPSSLVETLALFDGVLKSSLALFVEIGRASCRERV